MRILIALGGNALLRRGEPMTMSHQIANIRRAAQQIARLADGNQLVIAHGNGPQVGLLALQAAAAGADWCGAARCARRRVGRHDRLSARAGTGQRIAAAAAGGDTADARRGRRRRSCLHSPHQANRSRLHGGPGQNVWPSATAGASLGTATASGASSRRRNRDASWRFSPFTGCSITMPW